MEQTWAYSFAPGAGHKIELAAALDGSVVADAIRLVGTISPASNVYYIHSDQIATPQKITNGSQAVVWDRVQDPFGVQVSLTSSGIDTALRFPGQQYDSETGYHHNHWRDYGPNLGRYIESDPIRLEGGADLYACARGNPVSYVDPFGLKCLALGNTVTCTPPGGQTVSFPRPAGPPSIIDSSTPNYHHYDIQVPADCITPSEMMKGIANAPTPGSPDPATAGGTPNNATPSPLPPFFNSPVKSYLMSNGTVVNVTLPGHPLFTAYVGRSAEDTGSCTTSERDLGGCKAPPARSRAT